MKRAKQKSEKSGRRAEGFACFLLMAQGFRIIARRWRPPYKGTGGSEIDIIAKRGNLFIFVEVKFRQKREDAIFSLTEQQQQALAHTAAFFLAAHVKKGESDVLTRFDGIFLAPWRLPVHIANAWEVR